MPEVHIPCLLYLGLTDYTLLSVQADVYYHVPTEAEVAHSTRHVFSSGCHSLIVSIYCMTEYHLRELAIKSGRLRSFHFLHLSLLITIFSLYAGYARKPYLFDISDLAIFDAVVNAANLKSAQPKPVRIGRKRKRSRESGSKMDENHVPARSKKPKLRIGVASSSSTNTTPPHAQDLKLTVMKPNVTLPHLSCCVQ